MNFLSHAVPYLDRPLVAAATGVPDWLSIVDRKIRARSRLAAPFVQSDDLQLRDVAVGIIRHHEDDAGFRPTFVGHILIEMLLDSLTIRDQPDLAERYYFSISEAGAENIQRCVNQITGKPTDRLAAVIERFVKIAFLYDYRDVERLLFRLNQVMNRVGLEPLPQSLLGWLPEAEKLVESRRDALLALPDPS